MKMHLLFILAVLVVAVHNPVLAATSAADTTSTEPREPRGKGEQEEETHEGTLGNFGKQGTKKKPAKEHANRHEDNDTSDDEDAGIGASIAAAVGTGMFKMTLFGLGYGGATSWYRVREAEPGQAPAPGMAEMYIPYIPREPGEPLIPFVALNAGYQNVESDVNAMNARLEAGYGPVAVFASWTRYQEDHPDVEMDLVEVYGLYRMSFGEHVEIDMGIGTMDLSGAAERSGMSMTTPLKIQPTPRFGLAFRPAWGWMEEGSISDYELVASVGLPYVALNGGYRWLKNGDASLDGPIVDLQFRL
jgi:hypothetical protein